MRSISFCDSEIVVPLLLQMTTARDLLVLIGVLTQLGAVGSSPLSSQQLIDLQGSVYGEVAVLLQQATLAFWLCSTHATAGVFDLNLMRTSTFIGLHLFEACLQ